MRIITSMMVGRRSSAMSAERKPSARYGDASADEFPDVKAARERAAKVMYEVYRLIGQKFKDDQEPSRRLTPHQSTPPPGRSSRRLMTAASLLLLCYFFCYFFAES